MIQDPGSDIEVSATKSERQVPVFTERPEGPMRLGDANRLNGLISKA